jgi:hypothetical protein
MRKPDVTTTSTAEPSGIGVATAAARPPSGRRRRGIGAPKIVAFEGEFATEEVQNSDTEHRSRSASVCA